MSIWKKRKQKNGQSLAADDDDDPSLQYIVMMSRVEK